MGEPRSELLVSFSGGRTSAYMAKMLMDNYSDKYNFHFVFANTGLEHEKTLEFVNNCDKEWGLNVVWVEAVVHFDQRKACTSKVVNFETASRKGEAFEEVTKKYGIPNKAWPHCNRELKLNPIHHYMKNTAGIDAYETAIGIRVDEARRRAGEKTVSAYGVIYPLLDMIPADKQDVLSFWELMPFDLGLPEHLGNCQMCFKKSESKLMLVIKGDLEPLNFHIGLEEKYGLSGCNLDGTKRKTFRHNESAESLLERSKEYSVDYLAKISKRIPISDCGESCDILTLGTTQMDLFQ